MDLNNLLEGSSNQNQFNFIKKIEQERIEHNNKLKAIINEEKNKKIIVNYDDSLNNLDKLSSAVSSLKLGHSNKYEGDFILVNKLGLPIMVLNPWRGLFGANKWNVSDINNWISMLKNLEVNPIKQYVLDYKVNAYAVADISCLDKLTDNNLSDEQKGVLNRVLGELFKVFNPFKTYNLDDGVDALGMNVMDKFINLLIGSTNKELYGKYVLDYVIKYLTDEIKNEKTNLPINHKATKVKEKNSVKRIKKYVESLGLITIVDSSYNQLIDNINKNEGIKKQREKKQSKEVLQLIKSRSNMLIEACFALDEKMVDFLLSDDVDLIKINYSNAKGQTPISAILSSKNQNNALKIKLIDKIMDKDFDLLNEGTLSYVNESKNPFKLMVARSINLTNADEVINYFAKVALIDCLTRTNNDYKMVYELLEISKDQAINRYRYNQVPNWINMCFSYLEGLELKSHADKEKINSKVASEDENLDTKKNVNSKKNKNL